MTESVFDENWRPDVVEKGRDDKGQPTSLDKRLFMQLQVYRECPDTSHVVRALSNTECDAVVYEDINDPMGVGILTMSEDPTFFVTQLRNALQDHPFDGYVHDPEFTMLGRTYSIGYETDLQHVLIDRPRTRAMNPALPWVVWYPLRRSGSFERLSAKEQRDAMIEHGRIGSAFGEHELGHDIRLACHGLDRNDNDFVIGLLGSQLHPLSVLVQTMRKTIQTSQHIEALGPFFVGKKVWASGTLRINSGN